MDDMFKCNEGIEEMDELIEQLENTKRSLENETNYAVMWLGETIDFMNNDDVNMALWSYGKYLEVLNTIDIDLFKKTGQLLHEKLISMKETEG